MKKRFLLVLLMLLVVIGALSVSAGAEDTITGTCGENAKWSFDRTTGVLSITGTGKMEDYVAFSGGPGMHPWRDYDLEIKSVIIAKGITRIGEYAFCYAENLTSVEIPDTVKEIGRCAFFGCAALKTVKIPNGVKKLEVSVFESCNSLVSVEIPATVTEIEVEAFAYCHSLASVEIPAGVTKIGVNAFENCLSLTQFQFPAGITDVPNKILSSCDGLTRVVIPNGVTNIGDGAFQKCKNLVSVSLPNSVTRIGVDAFRGCSKLVQITIPASVTELGGYAFAGCTGLTNLTIPESVKEIYNGAFSYCTGLREIVLPANPTYVDTGGLFEGCTSLTEVVLPKNLTWIGNNVFKNCTSLVEVTIPEGVTSIGFSAFNGCSALAQIRIPAGMTEMDIDVFGGCTNLKTIVFTGKAPRLWEGCFSGVTADVYYPDGDASWTEIVKRNYGGTVTWSKDAPVWHNFVTIPGKAATCTQPGLTDGKKCSDCNLTALAQKEIPVVGHGYYETGRSQPDCQKAGIVSKKCAICGQETQGQLGAREHTYSDWTVVTPPSAVKGQERRECLCCGSKEYRDIPPLGEDTPKPTTKPKEHHYVTTVTPPICNFYGYTTHTCTECGDSYVTDRVEALGHDYSQWKREEDNPERESRECARCGKIVTRVVGSPDVTIPTVPPTRPTQPSTQATQPATQPTQSTQPSTQPTEPSTQATQPTTQATVPATQATAPSVQPTQPSGQPSSGAPTVPDAPTEPKKPGGNDAPTDGLTVPLVILGVLVVSAAGAGAVLLKKRRK